MREATHLARPQGRAAARAEPRSKRIELQAWGLEGLFYLHTYIYIYTYAVCVYICVVYIYIYIYTYIYLHVYIHIYLHVYIYVYIHICIYMYDALVCYLELRWANMGELSGISRFLQLSFQLKACLRFLMIGVVSAIQFPWVRSSLTMACSRIFTL